MKKIALNGFGRIGKSFVRVLFSDASALRELELVAINCGPADRTATAYGLLYDSVLGKFNAHVSSSEDALVINDHSIRLYAERDAAQLPWKELGIDWVIDVTGKYTNAQDARAHLQAGAKKVLISAPATGEDVSIIPGVNAEIFDAQKHTIVSLGSCTTNALMPCLKIMDQAFGIERAQVVTTHAYTNSQKLLDVDAQSKDPRHSRSAGINIIPTSTGASRMIDKVLPNLAGKITATSIRVPVPDASLLEITTLTAQPYAVQDIVQAFERAAQGELKGIVAVSHEPLVSSDYIGNPYSVTLDAQLTTANGNLSTIYGWYDNEWGYSNRLKDFLIKIA